ncbi:MAG: hypothetical protein JO270_19595 [Acidobacteriaceae bacterium]|nr:hypothetical protein [Acidobacteriaceae bacterium]
MTQLGADRRTEADPSCYMDDAATRPATTTWGLGHRFGQGNGIKQTEQGIQWAAIVLDKKFSMPCGSEPGKRKLDGGMAESKWMSLAESAVKTAQQSRQRVAKHGWEDQTDYANKQTDLEPSRADPRYPRAAVEEK